MELEIQSIVDKGWRSKLPSFSTQQQPKDKGKIELKASGEQMGPSMRNKEKSRRSF